MTPLLLTNSWKRSCLNFFQGEREVKHIILMAFYLPPFHHDNQHTTRTMRFLGFPLLYKVFQLHFIYKLNSVISYTTTDMYFLQSCPNTEQYGRDVKTKYG